jgi:hypothetical protein
MACRVAIFPGGGRPKQTDYASVKEAFCEWLAAPKEARDPRDPRTLTDFTGVHGVHRATLHEWKVSNEVQERVRARIDAYLPSNFGTAAYALVDTAEAGSMEAVKTYFRYFIGVRDGESLDRAFERHARADRERKRKRSGSF